MRLGGEGGGGQKAEEEEVFHGKGSVSKTEMGAVPKTTMRTRAEVMFGHAEFKSA